MRFFIWDTERIKNTKIYMLGYIYVDSDLNILSQNIIIDDSIDVSNRNAPKRKVNEFRNIATIVFGVKELFDEIRDFFVEDDVIPVCFSKEDFLALNDQLKLANLDIVEGSFLDISNMNFFSEEKVALGKLAIHYDIQHDAHNPLSDALVTYKLLKMKIEENVNLSDYVVSIPCKSKTLMSKRP
ncbi:hypothetical protein KHQ82_01255 [Mycoplasmatota bacterium]|nr:hypothetical protein KHQ82_01255 [Mycoplasmatota bacterium]